MLYVWGEGGGLGKDEAILGAIEDAIKVKASAWALHVYPAASG
jgi:hypothetical protein